MAYREKGELIQGKSFKLTLNLFLMEKKRIGEIIIDSILIALSFFIGFVIRFDGMPALYQSVVVQSLPLLIPLKLLVFYYYGLYRGLWRYIGMEDLLNIVKAVTSKFSVECCPFYHAISI